MARPALLLGMILFCFAACQTGPTIAFHYDYDSTKEVLDTTSTLTNAWYIPIEKKFVDYYNSRDSTKCLIDPATLRGIFWKSDHFLLRPLPDLALPDETKYYVGISAEGIGFDGYAIVSFLRVTHGTIDVDASFGTFSDNDQRDYSSSFYKEEKDQSAFNDSIAAADQPVMLDRKTAATLPHGFQWFGIDSLTARRKYNTLFFGVVPHPVVDHALSTTAGNLFIELAPEDYEYRLLNCKTKFGMDVRAVDETYLYNDFQMDWRYLLMRATIDATVVREGQASVAWLDLQAYPSAPGPGGREQYLFPNLNIQEKVLRADSSVIEVKSGETPAESLVDGYDKAPRRKKLFQIAKSNCLLRELLGDVGSDSVRMTFDTSAVNRNRKTKDKTVLGNGLTAFCYVGEESNGAANGNGTLYLGREDLDTARSGFATVSGSFKDGYLDGVFRYRWHDPKNGGTSWLVAGGEYEKGRLTGKLVTFDPDGHALRNAYYADGVFGKDTVAVFHNYDNVTFLGLYPKISDAYMGYSKDELSGVEIPYDTTFRDDDISLFIRDNVIYVQMSDCFLVVSFYRDYLRGKIVPINPVWVYLDNGNILESNWDDKYFYSGPSRFFMPQAGWQPTIVVNGTFHYLVQGRDQSSGFGKIAHDVGHFVERTLTDPLNIPSHGLSIASGRENAAQALAGIKADYQSTLGANLVFDGDIVHLTGLAGKKLLDLTAPAFKTMQDCNNALLPMASRITLQRTGDNLGIAGNEAEQLFQVASWAPEFGAQLDRTASELAAKSAVLGGTISEKLGEYMELAAGGFPKAILNPLERGRVPQATATVSVSAKVLQRILDKTFARPINRNDPVLQQISITGPSSIVFDSRLQAIDVSISGGNLSGKDVVSGTVTIDHCNLEFLPSLNRRNGHFFLDLHAIVTYLDLHNTLSDVDKMVAWALQTEFLNQKPLASLDVTNLLNQDIKMELKGQKELSTNTFRHQQYNSSINLDNLSWSIAGGELILSAALSIRNQTASAPFSDVSSGKTSEAVTAIGKLFGVKCNAFPEVKGLPLPSPLGDTDLVISLDERFMENLVANLFSHPIEIPLSQDSTKEMSDHYIIINKLRNFKMRDSNRIEVGVAADFWYRRLLPFPLKTRLRVSEFNLVLIPKIVQRKDSTWLDFPAQIESILIDGLRLPLDQCIANYVTDKHYLDHDSLDLTPSLALHLKSPLDTAVDIAPKITKANIITDSWKCRIYVKVE